MTNNAINTTKPIPVLFGGTGASSLTAYGPICGGTTTTGAVQSISSGTANQILTSNGASALPSFQAAPSTGSLVKLATVTNSGATGNLDFISLISATYSGYFIDVSTSSGASTYSGIIAVLLSTDNGSTWLSSGYQSGINYTPYNSTTVTNVSSEVGYWEVWDAPGTVSSNGSAQIWLFNLNSTNHPAMISRTSTNRSGTLYTSISAGTHSTSTAVNAIRVTVETTSTSSATLYGLKT